MMVTVMVRPPQRASLNSRSTPKREEKLAEAGGAVRLVGKISVIDARDGEHPQKIKRDRGPRCDRAHSHPENREAAAVQNQKRNAAHPIDLVGLAPHFVRAVGCVIGVKPLHDGRSGSAK